MKDQTELLIHKFEEYFDYEYEGIATAVNEKDVIDFALHVLNSNPKDNQVTAEEILREHCNTQFNKTTGDEEVYTSMSAVLIAMQEYASLQGGNERCNCNSNDHYSIYYCKRCDKPLKEMFQERIVNDGVKAPNEPDTHGKMAK